MAQGASSEEAGEPAGPPFKEYSVWAVLFFLGVVFIITALASAFVALVFSLLFTPSMTVSIWYFVVFLAIDILVITSQVITHKNHGRIMLPLYLTSNVLMGAFMYYFLGAVLGAVLLVLIVVVGLFTEVNALVTAARALIGLVVIVPTVYGLIEARFLRVRRFTVPVKGLSRERVRVGMVSDLHLGLLVGKRRLKKVLGVLENEQVDLIVIGGDLYDAHPKWTVHLRPYLRRFREIAPTYAVLGNHEFFHDAKACMNDMKEAGIEAVLTGKVSDEGTGSSLYCLPDPDFYKTMADYRSAFLKLLKGIDGSSPAVVLAHQPHYFRDAAEKGAALMLSGHTHAGQMWPGSLITKRIYKDGDRGLYRRGDSYLYVSVGAGTWGPPMRVLAPPEMAIIDLKKVG